MNRKYDAIVIGGRCAGSPTAMLLARKGYRVLLVDRATFPSDTLSTHVVQPLAVAALQRWGLLQRLQATGCPAIHTYAYDFGPFTIAGAPGDERSQVAYCPRRIVLDKLLLDAAVEAGVEVREGFSVEQPVTEAGAVVGIKGHGSSGTLVEERAAVVIGADGRHSPLAAAVGAEQYHVKPPLLAAYYAYYSGLPMAGRFETFIRERRGFAAAPTHDDHTFVVVGWPHAEFETNKKDVERHFQSALELAPEFAQRVRGARRESKLFGAALPNFFRKPYGPGWALVGDAGYLKDAITAQGINDAFHDAERCAAALDQSLSGRQPFETAMAEYQRARDEHALPMYELTCQLAALEPPPAELQQLLGAVAGNQSAMDDFARMNAGTISPAQFFAPQNVGAIMTAAAARR